MRFIRSIDQPRWPTMEWALNEFKIYLSTAVLSAVTFFVISFAAFGSNILIGSPGNEALLAWIGGGITVVAGGIWMMAQLYAKERSRNSTNPTVSADRGAFAAGGDISNVSISHSVKANSKKSRTTKP